MELGSNEIPLLNDGVIAALIHCATGFRHRLKSKIGTNFAAPVWPSHVFRPLSRQCKLR